MHWLVTFVEDILQWILLIVYIATFLLQIVFCVKALAKSNYKLWRLDLIFELVMGIIAFSFAYYFDNFAPDRGGFFPGLTYFGIVLFSIFAVIGYVGLLAMTLLSGLVCREVRKIKENRE